MLRIELIKRAPKPASTWLNFFGHAWLDLTHSFIIFCILEWSGEIGMHVSIMNCDLPLVSKQKCWESIGMPYGSFYFSIRMMFIIFHDFRTRDEVWNSLQLLQYFLLSSLCSTIRMKSHHRSGFVNCLQSAESLNLERQNLFKTCALIHAHQLCKYHHDIRLKSSHHHFSSVLLAFQGYTGVIWQR